MQCPFTYQKINEIKQYCETNNIPICLVKVDTLKKTKELHCVFNNWGAFYRGEFLTVNLLDVNAIEEILKDYIKKERF